MKYLPIILASLMFFVLASMPNWATAEETKDDGWVTTQTRR